MGLDSNSKKQPIEGCHVKVAGSRDSCVYIAPFCKGCNAKHGQELILKREITLVRANVNETCSRLENED